MDSFTDLQTLNEHHHHHHDVNPPPPQFSGNSLHPPYSEMIIAAICALKDKDGSSRQAIAKYIEKEYTNLPPTHPTLLTNHLKRMKNEGELIMVKHSYMVPPPRSSVSPLQDHHFTGYTVTSIDNSSFANANDNVNADVGANVNTNIGGENSAFLTPRRKPGRPPKPRQDFGFQPQFEGGVQDFQPQTDLGQQSDDVAQQQEAAEPVFASLGLADDGVAPLPPPENENVAVVSSAKRGRGRPPKSVASASGAGDGDVSGSSEVVELEKRKPGRPKGSVTKPQAVSVVNGGVETGSVSIGRPKRSVTKPQTVSVVNAGVETGSVSRGRGRPPKSKFRKLSSQSFGHPTKVGPGTAIIVTDPHQLVAYQELKSKYEHLQSKAKEVVGVVRPYVNPEYEAFGALQELESLVGVDANV